jgi:hypothetical protein
MNLRMICFAGALAMAACNRVEGRPATTAQIEGDQHVVVRAEAGRIWWAHRAWTEPHELWALPGRGDVENLSVTPREGGYMVTFQQDGTTFSGSFGQVEAGSVDHTEKLARSER